MFTFRTKTPRDFNTVVNEVCGMAQDSTARRLAGNHGLAIQTVSWEDTGRCKGSSWGPNISDMTLEVNNRRLPVIRNPNFADLTWDVRMKDIPIAVGNEAGEPMRKISLDEYLQNFRSYLHNPNEWPGSERSLLADRDTHVLMSSQACFLPVPEEDESKFNVCLYNYQSSAKNPAVLVIVATSNGTSAQIIEGSRGQKLYFNKNGQKASFMAQRLKDNRKERGVSVEGAMSEAEKSQNMVMVIQVPLVQAPRQQNMYGGLNSYGGLMECCAEQCAQPQMSAMSFGSGRGRGGARMRKSRKPDVDEAIIKVGASEGAYKEVDNVAIKRDERFPVRVTLQYYKATSNGAVSSEIIAGIADQLAKSQQFASSIGSLVVGSSNRVTEPDLPTPPPVAAPLWWSSFWNTYRTNFPHLDEAAARSKAFTNGRYLHCTMQEAETNLFRVLSSNGAYAPAPMSGWAPGFA